MEFEMTNDEFLRKTSRNRVHLNLMVFLLSSMGYLTPTRALSNGQVC